MRGHKRCLIQKMVQLAFWVSMVVWMDTMLKTTVFSEHGSIRGGESPKNIFITSILVAIFGWIVLRSKCRMHVQKDAEVGEMTEGLCDSIERKDHLPQLESIHMRAVVGGQMALLVVGLILWVWLSGGIKAVVQALMRMEHPLLEGMLIVLSSIVLGVLNLMLDRFARRHFPMRWWWDASFMFLLKLSGVRLLLITFLVAISEEIFFRGFVLTFMMQLFRSSLVGVVLASYVFMIMHVQYQRKPVLQFAVFSSGVLFSLLYLWTGSMFVVIAVHFLYDFMLLMVLKRWSNLYENDVRYDAALSAIEGSEQIDGAIRRAYERERQLERALRLRIQRWCVSLIRLLTVTASGVAVGLFVWMMFGVR